MKIVQFLMLTLLVVLHSCKGQNNQEEKPLTGFNKVELVLDNEFVTKDTITQKGTSFLNASTNQDVSVLHHIEETGFHMYNGMSFKSQDIGVIVGGAGLITRITKDGGKTWLENRFSRFGNPFYSAAFSGDNIFVIGDCEYIFTTPDLGENWSVFNTKDLYEKRGYFFNKYYKIRFVNEQVGFITGYGYINGEDESFAVILKTVDAGKTWTTIEHKGLEKETEGISDFVAFSEKEIIVVTFSGRSYKSTNGGLNWQLLFETDGEDYVNLNSIAFLNQNTGLMGGLGGDLFYTENGGKDWRKIDMPQDGDGHKANISDILFTQKSALITTSISSDYYRDTFVYEFNIEDTTIKPFLTSENEEVLFSGESYGIQAMDGDILILDRDNLYKTAIHLKEHQPISSREKQQDSLRRPVQKTDVAPNAFKGQRQQFEDGLNDIVNELEVKHEEIPADGEYIYDISYAEYQEQTMSEKVRVVIKGNSIKILSEDNPSMTAEKGDILDEGILRKHNETGDWLISNNPSDVYLEAYGDCVGSPMVIDFIKKVYKTC